MSDDYLSSPGSPVFNVGDNGITEEPQNNGVTPVFFTQPVQNGQRTAEMGSPQFDDQEMCMIIIAGDQFNRVSHPVDDTIKARFPSAYARWKEGRQEQHVSGTPLREWPLMTPSMIETLKAIQIKTVEDLASVSDINIQRIPDGRAWRSRAEAWLAAAKDGAAIQKYAAENDAMRAEIDDLKKQIADLVARMDEPSEKCGPGRPPKVAA